MKNQGIFGLLVLACWVSVGAEERPPNFIYVMTDDQGYQDLGCYGHPTIKTPNIDRMAQEGVRFTSFYARHKCTPARACLMTGAYNFRVGVDDIVHPHDNVGMCREAVTIPETLKPKGYTSALIGKWHLGHPLVICRRIRVLITILGCRVRITAIRSTMDCPWRPTFSPEMG